MRIAIIIPARYGSSRFPGKPFAMLGGQTMLSRVVDLANNAAEQFDNVRVFVTTEDQRIADHAKDIGATCLITSEDCATGSDRALAAAKQLDTPPSFIINLQGDAPFTPPEALTEMIKMATNETADVITPVQQLDWPSLDLLRKNKETTPFSGTTAILDQDKRAIWFSKNIIPAIRKEERDTFYSPVFKHIGLYGYKFDALEKFCALPQSHYEQLEGLEQLRFLENGMSIQTFPVSYGLGYSGIDTPEDLARAEEQLIK